MLNCGLHSGFRRCRALFLVSCLSTVAAKAAPAPPDQSSFLHAIRLVETGDRCDSPRGRYGELGAYQFRLMVWRQHTSAPFSRARTRFADTVAARHYSWIAQRLRANGVPATSWNIAAAWNSGVSSVVSGAIPATTQDYATRVVNLMERDGAYQVALNTKFQFR